MLVFLHVVSEWYADVGRGDVPFTPEHTLANLSLWWMLEEIVRSQVPINFDYREFAKYNIPVTVGQDVTETPQEGEEGEGEGTSTNDDSNVLADAQDVLLRIRDELIRQSLLLTGPISGAGDNSHRLGNGCRIRN
jgi:hypothetical protein